jgi:predicted peptidase
MFRISLVLSLVFGLVLSAATAFSQSFPSFEKKEFLSGGDTLRYRIQYPLQYDATKKYPLVLLLHGAGERGSDNQAQLVWGGSLFADSMVRARFPAIVVFPQCGAKDFWAQLTYTPTDSIRFHMRSDTAPGKGMGLVIQLLDELAAGGHVDTKRIYVGGLSMGGMGTFEILWRKPHFFAAAFPICGAGDPAQVRLYARKFPIWVFHGGADPVVPVANSHLMVAALKAAKAKVLYTEYPGVGHDSWKKAFAEPELLPWVFGKHR